MLCGAPDVGPRYRHAATAFGGGVFARIATAKVLVVGAGGIGACLRACVFACLCACARLRDCLLAFGCLLAYLRACVLAGLRVMLRGCGSEW